MRFSIPNEYSNITGLRHCKTSDFSGEDFYHSKLNGIFADAYSKKETLELVLDGSRDGYGPSFLDESIGNLVYDFTLDIVEKWLVVISEREELWLDMIKDETYQTWENRRINGPKPKVTVQHEAWFRVQDDGSVEKRVWIPYNK